MQWSRKTLPSMQTTRRSRSPNGRLRNAWRRFVDSATNRRDTGLLEVAHSVTVDMGRSVQSRPLVSRFDASRSFVVVDALPSIAGIREYVDKRARVDGAVDPARLRRERESGPAGRPWCRWSLTAATPTPPTSPSATREHWWTRTGASWPPSGAWRLPNCCIGVDVRVWFNPDLESRDFMVPGILALLLLLVATTNLSSMAIVRERETGTLQQLNVTPLARWEFAAGDRRFRSTSPIATDGHCSGTLARLGLCPPCPPRTPNLDRHSNRIPPR